MGIAPARYVAIATNITITTAKALTRASFIYIPNLYNLIRQINYEAGIYPFLSVVFPLSLIPSVILSFIRSLTPSLPPQSIVITIIWA